MAKKGLLKKIFGGKSKQPKAKDANPTAAAAAAGGGVVAVGVSPKVSPSESAAAEPTVIALQSPPGAGEHVRGSDSVTLDTESENSGSLRACKMEVREEAPVTPSTAGETPQANSFEEAPAGKGDAPSAPVLESDEDAPALENEDAPPGDDTPTATEGDVEVAAATGDDGDNDLSKAPAEEEEKEEEVKKEVKKKTWAEERVSQMYSSSASKPIQKTKVEVGHELNAERRKVFEGLSSPHEKAVPHVPDDVKKLGKLSDRMKAFQEKGGDPGPPKESPVNTPNREKAAAKRKAVEEMLKRQTDPTAFLETRGKETVGTPSPGRASAKKKQVEEMLKKQLDPKAFIDETKGHVSPESTPGKGELANKKKWVLETLEKQNDPKSFLDKQKVIKHTVDVTHENFGEKKDFKEHRKSFEGKVEAEAIVEGSQESVEGTEEVVEGTEDTAAAIDDPRNDEKVNNAEDNLIEPEEMAPNDAGALDPVQTTDEAVVGDEAGGDEKENEAEENVFEPEDTVPTDSVALDSVQSTDDGKASETEAHWIEPEETVPTDSGTDNVAENIEIDEKPQGLEECEKEVDEVVSVTDPVGEESTQGLHACNTGDEKADLDEQATQDNTQAPHIECTMPY